ncbi:ATP-dependent RNA helicase [Saccharobesus litoralis]|uniref:DEAD-box ATP-dependent RNA helicase RhpA n=1 Tax=Saccharobesus litoralis TaxID=2172099 RepID=A0A2S0VQ46_9ALTE|nr:DEAD/DEAH box helicase [Saccharobesus litoralis]AWB66336.1 ATP-dependent RNA helicase [Saccharobesus litoralis]
MVEENGSNKTVNTTPEQTVETGTPDTQLAGFESLGLSTAIVRAVSQAGYTQPSPIQAEAIPVVLKKRDLMAAAQTGTGKTAGFTLPMLDLLNKGTLASRNQVRALVLTPTRELAAQVAESVDKYGSQLPLTSHVVFGGVKINPQMQKLRGGADVLVATPGRLLDLYQQNAIKFDKLEILVLDEADRMLDMGFIRDIRKILDLLPKKRQTLMFSATFSPDIRALAKDMTHNPIEVSVTPENSTNRSVDQSLYVVERSHKTDILIRLIKQNSWFQVLVFTRTKHGANRLVRKLDKAKITAAAIHGDKSQGARTRALAEFKAGDIAVLVATDIAARGLDIEQLPQVVNFELPHVAEDYVHRIGRTGRAGATGKAISLVCSEEAKQLSAIECVTGELIERKLLDGYETKEVVPQTKIRPLKAKKPKKPKRAKVEHKDGQGFAKHKPGSSAKKSRHADSPSRKPAHNKTSIAKPQIKKEYGYIGRVGNGKPS